MKKGELVALLESVTVEELKNAIPLKEKFERLEKKRKTLERELASVVRQIESLGLSGAERPAAGGGTQKTRKKGRRISQPSLVSLLVEILRERKKPLKINEICDALLKEKNYRTRAKDFKAQVRVMMYRNDKGLFKKAGPGLFTLAADVRPERKTAVKAGKRVKKAAAKRATKKRTTKAKKKTTRKAKKSTKKKTRKAR